MVNNLEAASCFSLSIHQMRFYIIWDKRTHIFNTFFPARVEHPAEAMGIAKWMGLRRCEGDALGEKGPDAE